MQSVHEGAYILHSKDLRVETECINVVTTDGYLSSESSDFSRWRLLSPSLL